MLAMASMHDRVAYGLGVASGDLLTMWTSAADVYGALRSSLERGALIGSFFRRRP